MLCLLVVLSWYFALLCFCFCFLVVRFLSLYLGGLGFDGWCCFVVCVELGGFRGMHRQILPILGFCLKFVLFRYVLSWNFAFCGFDFVFCSLRFEIWCFCFYDFGVLYWFVFWAGLVVFG